MYISKKMHYRSIINVRDVQQHVLLKILLHRKT